MTKITITEKNDTTLQITIGNHQRIINIPSFKRSGMNKFRQLLQMISYEATLLLKEIEK